MRRISVLALSWILTVFQNFTWFSVAMSIQGCGVSRKRRLFGGVGFLMTLGVFCPTPESPTGSLWHHTPKLGLPVESAQFLIKLLLKQRILAVYLDFHWVLIATKFLVAKLHLLYVKESGSEILERSELESNILPPTPQPWMLYLNDGLYLLGHGGAIECLQQGFSYWLQILNGPKIWRVSRPIYHI